MENGKLFHEFFDAATLNRMADISDGKFNSETAKQTQQKLFEFRQNNKQHYTDDGYLKKGSNLKAAPTFNQLNQA